MRKEMRDKYDQEAKERKYKHIHSQREENRGIQAAIHDMGRYATTFLYLKTDDEVLYEYKRKLQKKIQRLVVNNQPFAILTGAATLGLCRLLQAKRPLDGLYFLIPWVYVTYSSMLTNCPKLFELSYPAHPFVMEKRSETLNKMCFYYPTALKNDIEYLHAKIHDLSLDAETNLVKDTGDNKYERMCIVGKSKNKLQFKIIVKDAQIYLKCIDKFEDIFELSKDLIKDVELTDILEPQLFDNHRDIVNSLFDVYRDLAQEYVDVKYKKAGGKVEGGKKAVTNVATQEAKLKIAQKYGLDLEEIEKAKNKNNTLESLSLF